MSLKITLPTLAAAQKDLPAGLVVFLVALPLCLGISLASGAPPFSGIIAGVVGGIVVSLFSGSELSVSGPAAGLASIVAVAFATLGSWPAFFASVVLAGVLQIGIGVARAGTLGNFIPHSVIKGMLAAIGITIILKQLPHAVGYDRGFTDEEQAFAGTQWMDIFLDPLRAFDLNIVQPGAVLITIVCIGILLLWESPFMQRMRWTKLVPGALICVVVGALLNEFFQTMSLGLMLTAENDHLVELPVASDISGFFTQFSLPDWSAFARKDVWIVAITIAAVASIESVLSVEAADKMDPQKRLSNINREMFAQGIGNMLSGLIGGLPVTSVIVRSSANIYAGARTRTSSFTHGILLLAAVVFIPTILNTIPLACLASVLLIVGYKLSSVKLIRSMWKEGITQFLPFMVTCVVVVATDILIGVAIGLVLSMFFVVRSYQRIAITLVNEGNTYLLRFNKDMTFIQRVVLKRTLLEVPDNSHLIVDGTKALYIDHDVYETVHDYSLAAAHKGITIEYHNYHGKQGVH